MGEKKNEVIKTKKEKKTKQKKKCSAFVRNLIISLIILVLVAGLVGAWFIFRPDNQTDKHNLFNLEMISELTTLECRYHNVAVRDREGGFLGAGRQYVWFEYDVIVDIGIDINEVRIEEPTADGVVRIYLPEAKILGAAEDKATISKPVCELAWFEELTAEDERQIINEGIQRLREDEKTKDVIDQAYNSAKDVIARYVINTGKLIGKEYTVVWIEKPEAIQLVPGE